MSKLVRITITLPKDLLDAADTRARRLDRSRSWVVAESLRQLVSGIAGVVREPAVAYGAREVAEARRFHAASDLRLSPAERLRRAEELGRLGRTAQRRARRQQVIAFDSYEDYYEWKKARLVGA
ncbi:MAG TPA: ribbon-helix-helix protein, CopG family [Gemmatimonadales bacterium]|nr:ribbon-helix-helix protein, CopG family [Gemmatimonadales bacterium]